MAITQALLAEEILSRQERAVIRGLYRAQQLADALQQLNKTTDPLTSSFAKSHTEVQAHVVSLRCYLESAIASALVSTKVPASALVQKDTQPSKPL